MVCLLVGWLVGFCFVLFFFDLFLSSLLLLVLVVGFGCCWLVGCCYRLEITVPVGWALNSNNWLVVYCFVVVVCFLLVCLSVWISR